MIRPTNFLTSIFFTKSFYTYKMIISLQILVILRSCNRNHDLLQQTPKNNQWSPHNRQRPQDCPFIRDPFCQEPQWFSQDKPWHSMSPYDQLSSEVISNQMIWFKCLQTKTTLINGFGVFWKQSTCIQGCGLDNELEGWEGRYWLRWCQEKIKNDD